MDTWRRCSSCKADIGFNSSYWVCSISTCTRPRTGFFFCSVACWEVHLPTMRHRGEAWAVEKRAPTREQWEKMGEDEEDDDDDDRRADSAPAEAPRRRVVAGDASAASDDDLPRDVLVVVSKLKKYIRARSGMNTSDNVVGVLSDHLRRICDVAIRKAGEDGRKTVLDRDFRTFL
jgi:hypothetical protein